MLAVIAQPKGSLACTASSRGAPMELREMAEFAAWLNARWPSRPRDDQWVLAWHADFERIDLDAAITAARRVVPQGLAPEGHELVTEGRAEMRRRMADTRGLPEAPPDGCSWDEYLAEHGDEIPEQARQMIDASQRRLRAEAANAELEAEEDRRRGVTAERRREAVDDLTPVGS